MSGEDLRTRAIAAIHRPRDLGHSLLGEYVSNPGHGRGDCRRRAGRGARRPAPIHDVWYEPGKLVRALADHISPPQEGNRMSEPTEPAPAVEPQDVTMNAIPTTAGDLT